MKKITSVVLCMLLSAMILCGFNFSSQITSGVHVYDDGDYLTSSEEREIEQAITRAMESVKTDFLVVFTDQPVSASPQSASKSIWDDWVAAGNGYGENHNTVILYVNMYSRDYFISEFNSAEDWILSDNDIDHIIDSVGEEMSEGDYGDACMEFVEGVVAGSKPGFFSTFPGWLVVGLIGGAVVTLIVVFVHKRPNGVPKRYYMKNGTVNVVGKTDQYLRTTTVSRRIETSSGGGGGRSSSFGGGGHGGGGKF